MHKIQIQLDDDVYLALREAYSLKEMEDMMRKVLTEHLKRHIQELHSQTKPEETTVQNLDPLDHSPHEWTH